LGKVGTGYFIEKERLSWGPKKFLAQDRTGGHLLEKGGGAVEEKSSSFLCERNVALKRKRPIRKATERKGGSIYTRAGVSYVKT